MPIIRTGNLTKKFKDLVAVNSVNLSVEAGECLGLLGPNGAGKTSLIRMITGVAPATAGEIWVDGKNFKQASHQIKAELGVVPQVDNLDPDLSVLQNLLTSARYFEIPKHEAYERSMEILRFFPLSSFPKILQDLSWIAPLTPAVHLTRSLFSGHFEPNPFISLAELIILSAIFFSIALATMRRRLTR
ncbi:MAG: ABC transporter ATP-binding protein/permease [Dehalococcoidales bacterium]|nr:ABC transporter ATP-binding protein/permease [Dehalococcoidales bacterium]